MRWLLIDQILECEPGVKAKGVKTFSRSEVFFMDHFPGMPIVPGVLQIEMMAQLAGKCYAIANPEILPVLGTVKAAKFYGNVNPGDRCIIQAVIVKASKGFLVADASIEVEGKKVSSASILFGQVQRSRLSSQSFDAVVEDWKKRQQQQREGYGA
ncbi:MAG: 3-hydroxyacyl-ACP dehydratase FabZ family protein [Pseudobdellovibrionaceae bacterium]